MHLYLLLLACTHPVRTSPPGEDSAAPLEDTIDADTVETADDPVETAADTDLAGLCPPGMALAGAVCVDRWEARLERWDGAGWAPMSPYEGVDGREVRAAVPTGGEVPQAYVSGDEAAAACVAAGKRLCTSDEWLAACRGPDDRTFPYGDAHVDGACNDRYDGGHPVVDYFGTADGVWDGAHMNDPGINQQAGTVAAGGAFTGCVTPEGVADLHGNLHEWVDDAAGTFRGGFYADASINGVGCGYATTAHDRAYHDYSTGFRCCVAP